MIFLRRSFWGRFFYAAAIDTAALFPYLARAEMRKEEPVVYTTEQMATLDVDALHEGETK